MSDPTTTPTSAPTADLPYAYRVVWSPEDQEYVATATEWGPGLSWLDADPSQALEGLRREIRAAIADLTADGKPVPEPLASRTYSGKFMVRLPTGLHRDLAIAALEEGVSLNRYVAAHLARELTPHPDAGANQLVSS